MTQLPLPASADASRLVRLLNEWVEGDVAIATRGFAERLGQLFDLPDSIRISSAHASVSAASFEAGRLSIDEVRDEFFRGRTALIRAALRSFTPGSGHTRIRFPLENASAPVDEATDPEPYLAFYIALQRDIDFRARNLQAAVRDSVAGFSPTLAQLCALDSALTAPIAANHRRLFGAIPKLLQNRFEFLLAEYRQTVPQEQHQPDLWAQSLSNLRDDMQSLALAEIETRLLPTLGLIEALEEHTQR
tara:strand:+ start:10050 stop:10790 length:741 start_codon:yes stop_codon:yes gene_type:complete